MKKFSVLWVIALFMLPCPASADVDMNKIREVNEHCPKIDSGVVIIAREAAKKCKNKSVLKAVLFYHSDFGSRFFAAKKISDTVMMAAFLYPNSLTRTAMVDTHGM